MNKEILEKIVESISRSPRILIGSHINPDGDNLGSSLGLYKALSLLKKDVSILEVDTIPEDYLFLPAIDDIQAIEEEEGDYIFIALDSADIDRLGRNKDLALKSKTLINIDHHGSNPAYGDLNYIDSKASATGELVYLLIKELDKELVLNKEVASCLYTAISTDTGSFMYSNTTSRTHRIAAELLKSGIDTNSINVSLYQNKPYSKVKLFNRVMSDLRSYKDGRVLLGRVLDSDLEKTGTTKEDTEGLVEEIRNIKSVELAILLKEGEDRTRVSLRSKNYVDCASIAASFNGGGHVRAAGCSIYENIDDAEKLLIKEIEEKI